MVNCRFCNLSSDEHLLANGELSFVVLSNPRLVEGHLLIIPRRHVEKPWALTKEEIFEMFGFVKKYQKSLSSYVNSGCDLREHYRPFMGETKIKVNHIHFHLMPRTNEDQLYQIVQIREKDMYTDLGDEEAQRLMNALS